VGLILHLVKDGVPDGLGTSGRHSENIWMIGGMSSRGLLAGFQERLALLRAGQNNFSALAIILSANSYSYDMEEGATHEKI